MPSSGRNPALHATPKTFKPDQMGPIYALTDPDLPPASWRRHRLLWNRKPPIRRTVAAIRGAPPIRRTGQARLLRRSTTFPRAPCCAGKPAQTLFSSAVTALPEGFVITATQPPAPPKRQECSSAVVVIRKNARWIPEIGTRPRAHPRRAANRALVVLPARNGTPKSRRSGSSSSG